MFKNFISLVNLYILGVAIWAFFNADWADADTLDVISLIIFFITPILTIFYLYFFESKFESKEESIISLWLRLKKKKIREELEE